MGAKIIGDLGENGLIDETDATKMSAFCSTSGPLFIVGSVGVGMFGSAAAGKLLFIVHAISALITGLIFRFFGRTKITTTLTNKNAPKSCRPQVSPAKTRAANGNALYDCVYSSVISIATVGGFICVFYVVADIFQNLDLLRPIWKTLFFVTKSEPLSRAFSYGLIECTRGCKMLALCGLSTYSLAFASSLIAFGGVSVLVQSVCFLKKANVKIPVFLLAKTIQTVISFLLTLALTFVVL